jgi:phosphonate metabolism protein (transferase hexapeptide repeat family)
MTMLSENPTIREPARLENVSLGAWTEIGEYAYFENVEFGDFSYTGPFCFLQNVRVLKFANIAAMVRIGPTMHPAGRPTMHHFTYRRKLYGFDDRDDEAFFNERASRVTVIGNDTWIGHGAIIMPGITVGDGAIVGSGAVVTKDVEPYTIVAGVPGRFLRRRFPVGLSERLARIGWWDWPVDDIKSRLADFSGSAEAFAGKYGSGRQA